MKNLIKNILIVIIGSIFTSCGISLYLRAGFGADPLTVFTSGISHTTGLTIGQSSLSIMAILVVFISFFDRKRIGIGTIMNAVVVGTFIDIFFNFFKWKPAYLHESILMLGAAAILVGLGVGTYISAGLGEGAVDALMVLIHKKTSFKLKWVKISQDIFFLAIGGLLGGKLGIGTVVGVLATGPIIEFTLKIMQGVNSRLEKPI